MDDIAQKTSRKAQGLVGGERVDAAAYVQQLRSAGVGPDAITAKLRDRYPDMEGFWSFVPNPGDMPEGEPKPGPKPVPQPKPGPAPKPVPKPQPAPPKPAPKPGPKRGA